MESYVQATGAEHASRLTRLIDRIVAAPVLHGRFLNTMARLEYVGVRKMLKARRSERLDEAGLEHMLDEAVHALRLKRAALAVTPDAAQVATFAASHTLAGDAGESYFQAVDRRAEELLADVPEGVRGEAAYLLTSAAIEIRARAFYPLYEERLRAAGAKISVSSILRDEARHLANMREALEQRMPEWRPRLEVVMHAEAGLFSSFLDALEADVESATCR